MDIRNKITQQHPEKIAIISGLSRFSFGDVSREILKVKKILLQENLKKSDLLLIIGDYNLSTIATLVAAIDYGLNILIQTETSIINNEKYINKLNPNYKIRNGLLVRVSHESNVCNGSTKRCIFLTSGSTGVPKAIVHDTKKLLNKFLSMSAKSYKTIGFLTLDHMGGFNTLMSVICSGSTLVVARERSINEIFTLIAKEKITVFSTTPTFLKLGLISNAFTTYDVSSLVMLTYGTEAMSQYILDRIAKLLPSVKLKQTYGLTEIGVLPTQSESDTSLFFKIASDEVTTKIVDDLLYIKCKSEMNEIIRFTEHEEVRVTAQSEDWFCTGDKVEQKGDFIRVLGRESDLINVGGEKIYPSEIEDVINRLDFVDNVVAYGRPHALFGNVVGLKVVVSARAKERKFNRQELRQLIIENCQNKLPKFALPMHLEVVESISVSERFKTLRG